MHSRLFPLHSWKVWSLLFVLVGGLLSCAPAKVELDLFYPYGQDGTDIYNKISRFAIDVRGESISSSDGSQFEPGSSLQKVLPNLKCDREDNKPTPKLDIEVTALDGQNKAIASGRSIVFHPCGKPLQLPVFIGPVGRFSILTAFFKSKDGSSFTEAAEMTEKRAGHRVVQLNDGRLLITGGTIISGLGKLTAVSGETEFFDPTTGTFSKGPSMSSPRAFHTVTVIENSVIVAGGLNVVAGRLEPVRNVDIFTINSAGKLVRSDGPSLTEGRAFHTSTQVGSSSNILIFGGLTWLEGKVKMATQWEILDYTQDNIVGKGPIDEKIQRAMHAEAQLENGRILLTGGLQINAQGQVSALKSFLSTFLITEGSQPRAVLDVSTETMKEARAGHTALVLQNNKVLLAGGMIPKADNIFVPQSIVGNMELFTKEGTPDAAVINLSQPRAFHSTMRLTDGRVLVFGGIQSVNGDTAVTANRAEIYNADPNAGIRPTPLLVLQRKDRFMHSATLMLNGSIVILGGVAPPATSAESYATLDRGELFNPHSPAQ